MTDIDNFKMSPPPPMEITIKFPEIAETLIIKAAEYMTKPDISLYEFSFAHEILRACSSYILSKRYENKE